ncbi:hypothetical protein P9112_002111 [Eukaryota sp. TZLM1-RC]
MPHTSRHLRHKARKPRESSKKTTTQPPNSKLEYKLSDKRVDTTPHRNPLKKSGTPLTTSGGYRHIEFIEEHPSRMSKATVDGQKLPGETHLDTRDTSYKERIDSSHKNRLHGSGV